MKTYVKSESFYNFSKTGRSACANLFKVNFLQDESFAFGLIGSFW